MHYSTYKCVCVSYDTEEDKVPYIEPYVIPEGKHKGKSVAEIVKSGVEGLKSLVPILVGHESHADFYQCSNSIAYELMKEAKNILEECNDDTYCDYLCALYELFCAMFGREHFCEYFFCVDEEFTSTSDILNYDEPCVHYDYLELIIDDIVSRPSFYYCIESEDLEDGLPDGTVGVFPGMKVAVVQKADQRTGKLTEGIVSKVFTTSAYHPRGIKVRLTNGKTGRVQKIFY